MTDETPSLRGAAPADGALHQETRRDFLQLVAGALGAVAVVATGYVLVDMLNPAADVLAAGGPVDIDLTKVAPGQQVIVQWRGKPIFIINRTPPLLKELQDASLVNRLADPSSDTNQQPPYARNWHRSIKPEYAVLVGICTHLGCIPFFSQSLTRAIRRPIGSAAISALAMARNTIWPGEFMPGCRRRITCRSRPIAFPIKRRCASAKIRPARVGILGRSSRSERPTVGAKIIRLRC